MIQEKVLRMAKLDGRDVVYVSDLVYLLAEMAGEVMALCRMSKLLTELGVMK